MVEDKRSKPEERRAQFACAACEHRGNVQGAAVPVECPRCSSHAIVLSKPDGTIVVPELLRKARALALGKGLPVGFAVAIEQGKMTVEQAETKGNRDAVAKRVVERHEIPLRMAYQVADGKLRIQEALQRTASVSPAAASTRPWRVYGWFLAAALVFLVGLVSIRTPPPEAPIDPNLRDDSKALARSKAKQVARLERNDQNQVTYVEGESPKRVLELYCESTHGKPIEVVKINTNRAQAIFEKADRRYAFDVNFDTSEKIWFSGGTGFPVHVKPVTTQ